MNYKPEVVLAYWAEMRLPRPEVEFMWCPGRRFRADFAWPSARLMLEVEGGIWIRGKHGRPSGIKGDMQKVTLAAMHGWRMIRIEPKEVCMTSTVEAIRAALNWVCAEKD